MPVIDTRDGKVEGIESRDLLVYSGIPYARPPVGALRWRPPERPERWRGVRAAKTYGTRSSQPLDLPDMVLASVMSEVPLEEDCLTLNVWAPPINGRARPVMVWIHGGAFAFGSGSDSIYDGSALVRRGDVVVVTVNYRLGALGFLRLTDITEGRIPSTGNEGLLDQILALEWVRDNIERFGGDPSNVTIFGESAGGMSVGALLGAPRARGLFRRAIAQSGAASTACSASLASELAEVFVEHLWLSSRDAPSLQSASVLDLTAATAYLLLQNDLPFQPCIDGELLLTLPLDAVRAGNADGVSVMVGATANEWQLFLVADPEALWLNDEQLHARVSARVSSSADVLFGGYRALLDTRGEPNDPASLYSAIETDPVFRLPALRLADALAQRGQPAYHYEFAWRSPLLDGQLKSCHAVDVGFVFGTHAQDAVVAQFFGNGPRADALAHAVQDAWTSFARDGTPRAAGLDGWNRYDPNNPTTAILDIPVRVASGLLHHETRLWVGQLDGSAVGRL